jgi:catechol 1,2-dioxygenase
MKTFTPYLPPLREPATRRQFLHLLGIGTVAVPLVATIGCGTENERGLGDRGSDPDDDSDDNEVCDVTNVDPYGLGPFYRAGAPDRPDLAPEGAAGDTMIVQGVVYGRDCTTPLDGAVVDVWQADDAGVYDSSSPEFWYRARLVTGTDGTYAFNSIYPGAYDIGPRFRPRHVHYRVSHPSLNEPLITQLYFQGDPFLAGDPGDEPSRTIALTNFEGAKHGVFDIALNVFV